MSLRISTGRSNAASVSRSVALERELRLAEGEALRVERAHQSDIVVLEARAQHLHGERAGRIVGGGERMRRRDAAFHDGDGLALRELAELGDELRTFGDIDAVGEPQQFDRGRTGKEARDRGQHLGAVDAVRLRLELAQPHARGARRFERDVAADLRQRDDRDAATVGLGARDQVLGGADARVPGGGRAPAVVDQERERRGGLRGRERRIPQRPRRRDDQQRREREAQQRQPPRRARGRLFLRQDVEQQLFRAELLHARARRNEAQQPPQHRQAQQPEQHQRLRETEREAHHAALPWKSAWRRLTPVPPGPAPMRVCSASRSSLAGRSVRWMMKLQPSRSVSARISARWRSTRA